MSYYYLISGLPDLSLEAAIDHRGKLQLDIPELVDTIMRNLDSGDVAAYRFLIYSNDVRNFLNVLYQRHHDIPKSKLLAPALLEEELLTDYQKNRSELPSFMSDFLSQYEDQLSTMLPAEMEDKLWGMYYSAASATDPFIAAYCQFEQKVRQFFATYNKSYFEFLSDPVIDDASMNQIDVGRSISADVLRDYPFVEGMDAVLAIKNPLEISSYADRVIWDYLEQNLGFFGKEQVYIYGIKLMIVAKWQSKDPEHGHRHFIQQQEDIKNKVRSLKTAVI